MKKDIIRDAQWENFINIILGIWIFSIPWVLGFGFERYEVNVIMWNFSMIGLIIVTTSFISLRGLKLWPIWLCFYTGIWLFFSPLFLVYWTNSTLLWNSIILGLAVSFLPGISIPAAERKKIYHRTFRKNLSLNNR